MNAGQHKVQPSLFIDRPSIYNISLKFKPPLFINFPTLHELCGFFQTAFLIKVPWQLAAGE